jgi:hypothetical protein
VHFCAHLCTPRKTSRSVTHPEISLGQARLIPEFFTDEFSKKKVYLGGMSILSILFWYTLVVWVFYQSYFALSQDVTIYPLRRPTSPSVNPKPGTSPLGHVRMSSTGIHILYVQLATYVPYRVPPRWSTHHAYIPTSLTRTPPYPSQLTRTCPWNCEGRLSYHL